MIVTSHIFAGSGVMLLGVSTGGNLYGMVPLEAYNAIVQHATANNQGDEGILFSLLVGYCIGLITNDVVYIDTPPTGSEVIVSEVDDCIMDEAHARAVEHLRLADIEAAIIDSGASPLLH